MEENARNSHFRNMKCQHNDVGFCKYREKCRKQLAKSVCRKQNCDKNCNARHPKPCKFKTKCKFLHKNICAFSHDTFVFDDGKSETQETLIKIVDFLKDESETNSKKIDKLEEQHRKEIK